MIQVIQWDCLEVMRGMDDNSVDLILTDPPYGIDAWKWVWWFWSSKTDRHYIDDWDKFTPSKEYFEEILRVWKNVVIFWWNFFTDKLPVNWHWIVRDKVWEIAFDNPFGKCELARTNIPKKSVNKYFIVQQWFINDWDQRLHPTQKPVRLMKNIINDYSNKWDIILDCFSWSWTTWVACKELGRDCILIEKEPKYIDIINKRLETTTVSLFV